MQKIFRQWIRWVKPIHVVPPKTTHNTTGRDAAAEYKCQWPYTGGTAATDDRDVTADIESWYVHPDTGERVPLRMNYAQNMVPVGAEVVGLFAIAPHRNLQPSGTPDGQSFIPTETGRTTPVTMPDGTTQMWNVWEFRSEMPAQNVYIQHVFTIHKMFPVRYIDGDRTVHTRNTYAGNPVPKYSRNKDGYSLVGVYLDPEFTMPFDFTTPITEDITVYGQYLVPENTTAEDVTVIPYETVIEYDDTLAAGTTQTKVAGVPGSVTYKAELNEAEDAVLTKTEVAPVTRVLVVGTKTVGEVVSTVETVLPFET